MNISKGKLLKKKSIKIEDAGRFHHKITKKNEKNRMQVNNKKKLFIYWTFNIFI